MKAIGALIFALISVELFPCFVSAVYEDLSTSKLNLQKRMMNEDEWHGQDTSTTYSSTGGSKPKQDVPPKPHHGEDTKTWYRVDTEMHNPPSPKTKQISYLPSTSKSGEIEESSPTHSGGSHGSKEGRRPEVRYLKPKHHTIVLSQELKNADSKFKKTHKKYNSKWLDKEASLREKITRKPTPSTIPRFSSIPGYKKRRDRYPEAKVTLNHEFVHTNNRFQQTFDENNKGRSNRESRAQARKRLDNIHRNVPVDRIGELLKSSSESSSESSPERVPRKSTSPIHSTRSNSLQHNTSPIHNTRSNSLQHNAKSNSLPYTPRRGAEEESALLRSTSGISSGRFLSPSPSSKEQPHGKSHAMDIDNSPEHKSGGKSRRTNRV